VSQGASRSGRPSSRHRPSSGRVVATASSERGRTAGGGSAAVGPAGGLPNASRPSSQSAAAPQRPQTGQRAAARTEGGDDDAELMPPPPRPVDQKASELLASKVGRPVVEASGKIVPPSSKALEKAGGTNVDGVFAVWRGCDVVSRGSLLTSFPSPRQSTMPPFRRA
jgi:hypothetical protein